MMMRVPSHVRKGAEKSFKLLSRLPTGTGIALVLSLGLSACLSTPQTHGHIIDNEMLSQVQPGVSQEQVQLVLGSPDTTSTIGGQAYYYISTTMKESPIFGSEITDQRVVAVYFDSRGTVTNIANYGLQDGRIFDFIQRKTVTGGNDLGLLTQMLEGLGRGNPFKL